MKTKLFIAALIIGIVISLVGYESYLQGFESGYAEGYLQGDFDGYNRGYIEGELAGYDKGLNTVEDELVFTITSRLLPVGYECHIFPKEDPWSGYVDYYFFGRGEAEFIRRVPLLELTPTPEPSLYLPRDVIW